MELEFWPRRKWQWLECKWPPKSQFTVAIIDPKLDPGFILLLLNRLYLNSRIVQKRSTAHPKQIMWTFGQGLIRGTKDYRWVVKKHTLWMALDHENKEDAGFSYQTNESHMERKRHQQSTLGIDVETQVRDHGSTLFFLCCCENRHQDTASSSHSIIGGFISKWEI